MKRPRLHPDDLHNDSVVLGATDALLLASDNYRKLTAKILGAQDRLQALCEIDTFVAFMDIEEAVNIRVNFMLLTVARWAFNEGRRSRGGDR